MYSHIDGHLHSQEMNPIGKQKLCLFCGKEIVGRSDKKYCDDICRNNYNYRYNEYNAVIKKINKSLLYNRNVLKSLTKRGKTIVKRQMLEARDFDFELMTGIYETSKKHVYILLYDYAYRSVSDEDVLILRYSR